jgi:hypothetical protein
MNHGLNDAKKDEEGWGRHAGIGEPARPGIGVGPASEREKRHDERRSQDQGRVSDCERRRRCCLRADDGMKGPK